MCIGTRITRDVLRCGYRYYTQHPHSRTLTHAHSGNCTAFQCNGAGVCNLVGLTGPPVNCGTATDCYNYTCTAGLCEIVLRAGTLYHNTTPPHHTTHAHTHTHTHINTHTRARTRARTHTHSLSHHSRSHSHHSRTLAHTHINNQLGFRAMSQKPLCAKTSLVMGTGHA